MFFTQVANLMINFDNLDFNEFETTDFPQWLEIALQSLKNSSDVDKLFSKNADDLTIKPIYTHQDNQNIHNLINSLPGLTPFLRHNNPDGNLINSWDILQELNYFNPTDFNKAILDSLNRGQNSIKLRLLNTNYIYTDKLATNINDLTGLSIALKGADLYSFPIYLDADSFSHTFLPLLKLHCDNSQFNSNEIKGGLYFDPITQSILTGKLINELSLQRQLYDLFDYTQKHFKKFTFISLNGYIYHNCGATSAQELAFSIANAVQYLKTLESSGIDIEQVANKFILVLGISTDFFNQIIKIRAGRLLWSKITEAIGFPPNDRKIKIHCVTSQTNKSILDQPANILRVIIETYSSVIGGADSITVLPHDYLTLNPNEFSDRIARNIQLVINHETATNRTIDPVGGTYFIENLTNLIAQKAWEIFEKIESSGGFYNSLLKSIPQLTISKIASETIEKVQKRSKNLVGVNVYPDNSESIPKIDNSALLQMKHFIQTNDNDIPAIISENENILEAFYEQFKSGENFINISKRINVISDYIDIENIQIVRYPKYFEELRLNANELKLSGTPLPKFLLLNFGTIEQFMARRDFSKDFLQSGGFECIVSPPFESSPDGIKKAIAFIIESSLQHLIICSDDSLYPLFVEDFSNKLKTINSNYYILLAGNPEKYTRDYTTIGVDEFIHLKVNAYELLKYLQSRFSSY